MRPVKRGAVCTHDSRFRSIVEPQSLGGLPSLSLASVGHIENIEVVYTPRQPSECVCGSNAAARSLTGAQMAAHVWLEPQHLSEPSGSNHQTPPTVVDQASATARRFDPPQLTNTTVQHALEAKPRVQSGSQRGHSFFMLAFQAQSKRHTYRRRCSGSGRMKGSLTTLPFPPAAWHFSNRLDTQHNTIQHNTTQRLSRPGT